MSSTEEDVCDLHFVVKGSKGDHYAVSFFGRDGVVTSTCSCMAGRVGQFCRHRIALLDGDVSDLVGDNAGDVVLLRDLVDGTELGLAYQDAVRGAGGQGGGYAALKAANSEAGRHRQQVRVIADIAGTGIKAGMVGAVVEVQRPGSRNPSFTDLAATAYLVRFTKKPLERWQEEQTVKPARLPIGAELWLRESEVELLG